MRYFLKCAVHTLFIDIHYTPLPSCFNSHIKVLLRIYVLRNSISWCQYQTGTPYKRSRYKRKLILCQKPLPNSSLNYLSFINTTQFVYSKVNLTMCIPVVRVGQTAEPFLSSCVKYLKICFLLGLPRNKFVIICHTTESQDLKHN